MSNGSLNPVPVHILDEAKQKYNTQFQHSLVASTEKTLQFHYPINQIVIGVKDQLESESHYLCANYGDFLAANDEFSQKIEIGETSISMKFPQPITEISLLATHNMTAQLEYIGYTGYTSHTYDDEGVKVT